MAFCQLLGCVIRSLSLLLFPTASCTGHLVVSPTPLPLFGFWVTLLHQHLGIYFSRVSSCKWKLTIVVQSLLFDWPWVSSYTRICLYQCYPSSIDYCFCGPVMSLYYSIHPWPVGCSIVPSNVPFFEQCLEDIPAENCAIVHYHFLHWTSFKNYLLQFFRNNICCFCTQLPPYHQSPRSTVHQQVHTLHNSALYQWLTLSNSL